MLRQGLNRGPGRAPDVAAQTDFLRRYCELHGLPVAGVYVDDGITGTTALEDRPEGRRLLEDAEAGAFNVVLVYRLDRLGRSLKSLLDAHERLDKAGVAIRSGTEPFDTAIPIGRVPVLAARQHGRTGARDDRASG